MSRKTRDRNMNNGRKPFEDPPVFQEDYVPKQKGKGPLSPKNTAQADYISSIKRKTITFGLGPAGAGKTYVASRIAARMLLDREVDKILLTRPAVEAGRPIGFLPGELEEKMAPYVASYRRGFVDELGEGHYEYLVRAKRIDISPLNFMQGLSWDDPTIVLFDEAENATPKEMKMFLTRIGENARVVISGDETQSMISGKSGMIDSVERIGHLKEVGVVRFTRADIVRSGVVRKILDCYDDAITEQKSLFDLPEFITNGVNGR